MGGKTDELKGRTKEAYGDLTDDERMKRGRAARQGGRKAKQKLDHAEDWAENKVDDVRDTARPRSSLNTGTGSCDRMMCRIA